MAEPKKRSRRRRVSISAEVDDAKNDDFVPKVIEKSEEAMARLRKSVEDNFLFKSLDDQQRQQVFGAMEEKNVEEGVEIIKQGDAGDFFYVLDSGSADVFVNGEKVHHYESGSSFGELALMYNCPRAATVTASSACALWALDRQTFRAIVYLNQSKKRNEYETFLKKCELFKSLNDFEITRIADVLEEKSFPSGTVVVQQGDEDFANMKFYLVIRGTAVATQLADDGKPSEVGRATAGGFFGEKALIERVPRAATVTAESETLVCACMDVAAFERLLGSCKDIMKRQIEEYSAAGDSSEVARGSAINAARALTQEGDEEEESKAEGDESTAPKVEIRAALAPSEPEPAPSAPVDDADAAGTKEGDAAVAEAVSTD